MIAGAFSSVSGKADTVLTTNGDMLYYNSGRQRLPKGSDGEFLKLASGLPSWAAAAGFTYPTYAEMTLDANGDTAWLSTDLTLNTIDTYGDASTDTVDEITGGSLGEIHNVNSESETRDVTFADVGGGSGRIRLPASQTLGNLIDTIQLVNSRVGDAETNNGTYFSNNV